MSAQLAPSESVHPPPAYTPEVNDIDWSYLNNPAARQDWTDRIHFVELRGPDRFLSITGQIRERGEYQDHPAFGAQPADNGYFLQRYLVSSDLHLGGHFRTFVQLESGFIVGRDGGPRPGIDKDEIDVNQAFIDVTTGHSKDHNLDLRLGRQLVSLGSTRLVATGVGLNVEQPFDGCRLTLQLGGWTTDLLALKPTLTVSGSFDNRPNPTEALWGVYLSRRFPHFKKSNIDVYYLGFDHKRIRYSQGTGREQRESVGVRAWSRANKWDYDFEYTAQFGRFAAGNIRVGGLVITSHTLFPTNDLRLILN